MAPGEFLCNECGTAHPGPPFAYGVGAPAYWRSEYEQDDNSALGGEQCVIEGQHFFVRGRVLLPVVDADEPFEWGVWVSLSRDNFERMSDMWENPERAAEPPYFGWLSTELPVYTLSTLGLPTSVVTQPLGVRPIVELHPSDHPLAIEQREGITRARVEEFASRLLH